VARLLLRILVGLGLAVLALVAVLSVVLALGFRVSLDPLRQPIEAAASKALGRPVEIEGALEAVPAFYPTVEVRGVRIANPAGWDGDLLRIDRALLQIGVLPLLWRRATVDEIRIEGGTLRLERRDDGRENWRLGEVAQPGGAPETLQAEPDESEEPSAARPVRRIGWIRELELTALELHELRVETSDATTGQQLAFVLTEGVGTAATDAPIELRMRGALAEYPFSIDLESGPLRGLVTPAREPWPLSLDIEIAGAQLGLAIELAEPLLGPAAAALDARRGAEAELRIELSGERLSSLSELARVELPDWGPWRFTGGFVGDGQGGYRADVGVAVGSSTLDGSMRVALGSRPPRVGLELRAETVQLDDFEIARRPRADPEKSEPVADEPAEEAAPEVAEPTASADGDSSGLPALLSAESLSRLEGELLVEVGQLLSGPDRLGAARLQARLHDGAISLEPATVEFPAGRLELAAQLRPTARGIESRLSLDVSELDLGVLFRRLQPGSDAGGQLTLDLELTSVAPRIDALMAHGNGRLDLGIFPERFEAGVIDLWVANLLVAVLPHVGGGQESVLNCVVGSFDLKDGTLTQRALMLDTSKMRVDGEARVDFDQRRVELVLSPRAKRPKLFSLATPVSVGGSFDDFGVGVKATDLVGTVIGLATGVVEVPARYLLRDIQPEDGTADCRAALSRMAEDASPAKAP